MNRDPRSARDRRTPLAGSAAVRLALLALLFLVPAATARAQDEREGDGRERDGREGDGAAERSPAAAEGTTGGESGEKPVAGSVAEDPRLLARTGEYELAIAAYRARLETSAGDVDSIRGLARLLADTGKSDEAIEILRKSPLLEKTSSLQSLLGRIALAVGRLDEADAAFQAALAIDPANVEALTRRGELLRATGRTREAEDLWNRVVQVYEDMSVEDAEKSPAEVFVEMGVALRYLNRYRDANETMFPQARDQDPECQPLLLEWARTYFDKYDFPFARKLLRQAIDLNPSFTDARVLLAENFLTDFQVGTERFSLAEKQLQAALEVNPRHAGALTAYGSLWLSDGDLDRAVESFTKSLAVNPASLETLGQLAACHFLRGGAEADFAAAEAQALKINPRAAVFYHTIALAIEKRFRYVEAAEMTEKALALDPDYWPAYHTLGINCLRTGKEARGREFLQKSYDKDPFNVWVVNTRKLLRHIDENHRELRNDRFVFRFPKDDYPVLETFLVPLLEKAHAKLAERYHVTLPAPIYIDVFSKHQWFSAKIVGLGGFPATGACFGNVVALTTPKALPQNWGAVAWHEFAHVVTLQATKNQIPRWLTEGLSVYEEGREHPRWARNFARDVADAHASGRLLPLRELDSGFSKPRYPNQVLISYFQGCLIVEYVTEKWGFDKVLDLLAGYAAKRSTSAIFGDVFDLDPDEFDKGFFAWLDRWVEATGYEPQLGEEVVERLELEVEEKPDDVKKLCDLAWAYLTAGNEIDAPLTANKALGIDAKSGDALAILGLSELQSKKTAKAKQHLAQALENGTRFQFRVHEALGRLAQREKDDARAIELLERARSISPRAGATFPPEGNIYYVLADLYNKTGEEEKFAAVLEDLRSFAPEDARCRVLLAKHYLSQDSEDAARRAFAVLEDLMSINPFDPKMRAELARAASRIGEHAVTIREYSYLLRLPDTNPRVAHLALAKAYFALGDAAKAKASAEKVLSIDADNAEAREILDKLQG